MDRDPQVLTQAFKRAKSKLAKIDELSIEVGMSEVAVNELVEKLSFAKAVESELSDEDTKEWTTFAKGQRYYVEQLVQFAGMDAQERLDSEYDATFADTASEEDMLTALS